MPTAQLSWSEGAPDQIGDGFRIYRSVNGGDFSLLATLPLTQLSYADSTISYGNTYRYRVVEYQGAQESPPAEIFVALPVQTESCATAVVYNRRPAKRPQEFSSLVDSLSSRRLRRPHGEGAAVSDVLRKAPARTSFEALYTSDLFLPRTLTRLLAEQALPDFLVLRGLARGPQESLSFSEAWTRWLKRGHDDGLLLDDGDIRAIFRTLLEILAPTLSFDRQAQLFREVLETAPTHEAPSRAFFLFCELLLPLSFDGARTLSRSPWGETAYTCWNIERHAVLGREARESAECAEATLRALSRLATENAESAEALSRAFAHILWVEAETQDAWARGLIRGLDDTAFLEASWKRAFGRAAAETAAIVEALSRALVHIFLVEAEIQGALARGLRREYADAVLPGESWERAASLFRELVEAVAAAEAWTRALRPTRQDILAMSERLSRAFARPLALELGLADETARRRWRELLETLPVAEFLGRLSRRELNLCLPLGARLAVPAKSTPYPWDTGKGGVFLSFSRREVLFQALLRELATKSLGRGVNLGVLARAAFLRKLSRLLDLRS